jgi:hypothetical protein
MSDVVQREWRRLHLRGTHWWEGTAFPPDRQREGARADAIRTETEEGLTKHLAEGWSIASVVAAGPVLLFRSRVGELWQEAFNVFLERPIEPGEGG